MYKFFLCLRYLRTRWIALASVISVTLGVATLIVVNSVMGGFATEMRDRVKGLLSDMMIEGFGLNGFGEVESHLERIRETLGDQVVAMTPVVQTPGFLIMTVHGEEFVELVQVWGIDMATYGDVCKFYAYLHEKELAQHPSFEVSERLLRAGEWWRHRELPRGSAVDQESGPGPSRRGMSQVMLGEPIEGEPGPPSPDEVQAPDPAAASHLVSNPFAQDRTQAQQETQSEDPESIGSLLSPTLDEPRRARGIIIPYLLSTTRWRHRDIELVRPGDEVRLALPHTSISRVKIEARQELFTTIGRFKSGMSEYDQSHCYVDIRDLQELRGMPGRVNAIYLKLRDYSKNGQVADQLRTMFPPPRFQIRNWEQKQGQLLSAVAVEQGILNVLLFLIIAVAGFGILAIFYMIVVEKMRDIGILKSLGASDRGVMQIFLAYGLGLGVVGSGLGMVIGLLIVVHLDRIEKWLSYLTGSNLFDRDLYYFDRIPTVVNATNITWIVLGALLIAVAASVLPARRAAALRPVESLRYE